MANRDIRFVHRGVADLGLEFIHSEPVAQASRLGSLEPVKDRSPGTGNRLRNLLLGLYQKEREKDSTPGADVT